MKFVLNIMIIICLMVLFFATTPIGRTMWNSYTHSLQKADEVSYETRKSVEDTARAYIASYNADRDIYYMYCKSDDAQKVEYAETARMRAVSTANTYNEYLRKNSYVWKNNMPEDIAVYLETIFE